jgi:hypothetical protein
MKGKITLEFTAKEAIAMLSNETLPKSLTGKIVKAFRESAITPVGKKASVVARATAPKAKKARASGATRKPAVTETAMNGVAHN